MSVSLLQTTRFRIAFPVWWFVWSTICTIVISNAGFQWQTAVTDSIISNFLLAGTTVLIIMSLQYYTPQKNLYGYLFSLCAVLSLVWLFTSRALIQGFVTEENYKNFVAQTFLIRGTIGFLIISCMALVAVLWYTVHEQQEAEKRRMEAERLSKEAELNSLRQQLQPHFLFNSLNSINALIGLQPQKARTMIQQLSDFLRGTLRKEQKEWVALEEELQHLQLYLDIEKVRFGHRLNAIVQNNTEGKRLPVMLLQPVVENAIKFGLYDTTGEITISIEATEDNGSLLLQVKNPFDPETSLPRKGTGFGLSSVQRRLYLLFARNDLLQTRRDENYFITTIKIPQP